MPSENPLRKVIGYGTRANDWIGDAISTLGSGSDPSGFVYSQYNNAILALMAGLADKRDSKIVKEIGKNLRASLESGLRFTLKTAMSFGKAEARRQLKAYGLKGDAVKPPDSILDAALEASLAPLDAQLAVVSAMALTDATNEEIFGSEGQVGVLRPSSVVLTAATWIATLVWEAWEASIPENVKVDYQKQAVAALDDKTTECCLMVHGQIQPFGGEFHLVGDPHYAEYMKGPPFHWYCRTSMVLYNELFDNGLTAQMQAGAAAIRAERYAGGSGYRDPVDAFGT